MRIPLASTAIAALTLFHTSTALHILLNNDDGWASANIRETYRLLKQAGHDVLLVAPVTDNSGQGGRSSFTTSPNLTTPGQFSSVPAGSPSLGHSPLDPHIWYYNGTPAACTFVALDHVLPLVWPNISAPDLLLAGPNVGQNLGPFLYTLSGTMGAAYAAVGRGVPAVAVSAGEEGGQRGWGEVNVTGTAVGLKDPATVNAGLVVEVVEQLVRATPRGGRLLPLGYGINVNLPAISSFTDSSCLAPPFIQTRLTGGAYTDRAVYNATSGLFSYGNAPGAGVNACINGDCALPGETTVAESGCVSTVSVFTVDYDAPRGNATSGVRAKLAPLVRVEGVGRRSVEAGEGGGRGVGWRHE